MKGALVQRVLAEVDPQGSLLTVCSAEAEREVLPSATHSGLTTGEDVRALPYDDGSFDWVLVSDGLHHVSEPHRGLVEMYRVARVGLIAVEASDNVATRLAVRLGLTEQYERSAIGGGRGGVDDSETPNYIYRWTEREFEKTLRAYDPTGPLRFAYWYALAVPDRFAGWRRLEGAGGAVLRRFANGCAMVAWRPTTRWPWLS